MFFPCSIFHTPVLGLESWTWPNGQVHPAIQGPAITRRLAKGGCQATTEVLSDCWPEACPAFWHPWSIPYLPSVWPGVEIPSWNLRQAVVCSFGGESPRSKPCEKGGEYQDRDFDFGCKGRNQRGDLWLVRTFPWWCRDLCRPEEEAWWGTADRTTWTFGWVVAGFGPWPKPLPRGERCSCPWCQLPFDHPWPRDMAFGRQSFQIHDQQSGQRFSLPMERWPSTSLRRGLQIKKNQNKRKHTTQEDTSFSCTKT